MIVVISGAEVTAGFRLRLGLGLGFGGRTLGLGARVLEVGLDGREAHRVTH